MPVAEPVSAGTTAGTGGAAPDRYAVIGHPIAHSLSPRIHALFAQQTGQSLTYTAIDIPPERLVRDVRDFFASGGCGLNVTVPHKQAALALADELSARARRAGAVNTLVRDAASGRVSADTTDGAGLVRDLTHNLGVAIGARRVLLLGAGGAARGVLEPLLACAPRALVIANRTAERAAALAHEWAGAAALSAASLELPGEAPFDLIIQATAAGLAGEMPALATRSVGPATICYDMSYGRAESTFLRWARNAGAARCHMGLGMLVEQAAESFHLWRGVRPHTGPVLAALRATDGVL
jgi:shikimate dehydrogenase